jgi:hypothetical protein
MRVHDFLIFLEEVVPSLEEVSADSVGGDSEEVEQGAHFNHSIRNLGALRIVAHEK